MHTNWKRNITLFIGSQSLSLFGSSLVQYAIMWYITLTTKSGAMMTISIICGVLPTFFLSPFAGVWADRYNRKALIMLSDAGIALATLLLAVLLLLGYDALWLLFVLSAVRALGTGVQTPAVGAILPNIVPQEQLTRVNATNGSIQALVSLVSPMVSGALLTVASIEAILFIDVVTAAIAIMTLLLFLQVPVHEKALQKQTTSYFGDMRLGFRYIKDHDYLKSFFAFCAMFFVLAAPSAFLTPLQVTRSFGDAVWRLTTIQVTFSVGMMLGGLLVAAWGGFRNRTHTMALATFGIGASVFALGVVPTFWAYVVCMGLIGMTFPVFNTPSAVLLQEKVEGGFLGRVFGVMGMLSSALMPLGMLLFGPIADVVRIEWLMMGTGVLLFVLGFFLVGSKVLLEAGKQVAAAARL